MKKTLRTLMLFFVVALVSGLATSCKDDKDDEPADPATHDAELVGTWTYEESGSDWWEKCTLNVKANGYFDLNEEYWDEEDGKAKYWSSGTWETANGRVYITYEKSSDSDEVGSSEVLTYRVSGNTLYLVGQEFTKK